MPETKTAKTVDLLLQEFRDARSVRMTLERELETDNPAAQSRAAHAGDADELDRLTRRAIQLPALIQARRDLEVRAARALEDPWIESLTSGMAVIGAEKQQANEYYNDLPKKHHEELASALAVVADADRRLIAAENARRDAQSELRASRENSEGRRP